jgi:amino acid permease
MAEQRDNRNSNVGIFDVETLIKRYRAAAGRAKRMAGAGKVFQVGYVFLIGAIIAYVVASRFGRFPIWPAFAAVLLVVAFWFGHRLYRKEHRLAAADALEAETLLRAYADRRPRAERDEILRTAGVPITENELDRLRPSDFEKYH